MAAWCATFHVVHRVKVRAGWMRRTCSVDGDRTAALKERQYRFKCWMQPKETVEVERLFVFVGLAVIRPRQVERRTRDVIGGLAMRHNHIQAVSTATQED